MQVTLIGSKEEIISLMKGFINENEHTNKNIFNPKTPYDLVEFENVPPDERPTAKELKQLFIKYGFDWLSFKKEHNLKNYKYFCCLL